MLVLIGSGDITGVSYNSIIWIIAGTSALVLSGVVARIIRGEEVVRKATAIMTTMVVANIVLDLIPIYGLDMGIVGASVAIVLATVPSIIFGLWYYHEAKLHPPGFRGDTRGRPPDGHGRAR